MWIVIGLVVFAVILKYTDRDTSRRSYEYTSWGIRSLTTPEEDVELIKLYIERSRR